MVTFSRFCLQKLVVIVGIVGLAVLLNTTMTISGQCGVLKVSPSVVEGGTDSFVLWIVPRESGKEPGQFSRPCDIGFIVIVDNRDSKTCVSGQEDIEQGVC
jgi:hypothetical protein